MPGPSERESYVKGSLAHLPLPKTLNYIHQAGKTGILAIARGPKKVHVHFEGGQIVHVTSSYFPDLALGEYLIKQGKITKEIAEESFEHTRDAEQKQGAWLVEHGHLTPHELFDALNTHVTLKLYNLFRWPDGDFFFKQGDIVEKEHRILKIHMGNLVYIGMRDHFPLKSLPTEFRGRKETPLFKRKDCQYRVEDMAFGPTGTRIYSIVNGEHTLRQIIALSKLKKGAAYRMLYGMFILGFIGFPESVQERVSKGERYQERVLREQEQRAKQKRGDGYEINIGDDVINEALRSVDRIREQVSSTPAGAADDDDGLAIPLAVEHVAEPEKEVEPPPPPLPAEDDDFGLRFDQEPADEFAPAPDAADEDGEFAWEADDGGDNLAQAYTAGSADLDLDQYSTPEDLLKQSVYLMDENRFEEAEKYLEKALDLDANFSEAIPYLGWCVYNRSGGSEAQRAEQIIKDGIQKSPKMYQSFLYLGKIYRAEKQPDFAELHFVKALELNVDCMEAKEEIKKIHQR